MIFPSSRFLWLMTAPLAVSLLLPTADLLLDNALIGGVAAMAWQLIGIVDGGLLLLLLLEGLSIPGRRRFRAERSCESIFSVNYAHRVQLHLFLLPGLRRNVRALVYDDHLEGMRVRGLRPKMTLSVGRNTIEYRLQIPQRGRYQLEQAYITCDWSSDVSTPSSVWPGGFTVSSVLRSSGFIPI